MEKLSTVERIEKHVASEWTIHPIKAEVYTEALLKGASTSGALSAHPVPAGSGPVGSEPAGLEPGEGRGKLGPYLKQLLRMVEDQPRAKIKDFYLALVDRGYYGSYDLVKKKIHSFRRRLGAEAGAVFTSPEAPYAQVEVAKVTLKFPDREIKAQLFTLVLGQSGRYYAELVENCEMGSFLNCHQNAFEFLGGVPAGIFYDPYENPAMRRLVGNYPFHLPMVDCATHYGYLAQATPAFAPWMKGRLKRPGKILKKHFLSVQSFSSLDAANDQMLEWIKIEAGKFLAQNRKDRLQRERLAVLPVSGFSFRDRRQGLRLRG